MDSSNLEIYLEKYFSETKNIWLKLLIFEYYHNSSSNSISKLHSHEKFSTLPTIVSYHFLRQLHTAINESSSSNVNDSKVRNFLINNIGGKILKFLSDLDLANVANETELVKVLLKIFPAEQWDENIDVSSLIVRTRSEIKNIYKTIQCIHRQKTQSNRLVVKRFETAAVRSLIYGSDHHAQNNDNNVEYTQYISDEFKEFNESHLSSAEISLAIIKICCKVVATENIFLISQSNRESVSHQCYEFCLKTLTRLNEHNFYNDSDQSVIKKHIIQLILQCFKNFMRCKDMPIDIEYKELFNQLKSSEDIDLISGLLICIVNTAGYSLHKESLLVEINSQTDLVLNKIEFIGSNRDMLEILQKCLMKIIYANKKARYAESSSFNHHHSHSIGECIFEKLLINSIIYVRQFKQLLSILNFIQIYGICCHNADIETMKIFMRSSTIPQRFIYLIEKKIMKLIFEKTKNCNNCNLKCKSETFKSDYLELLNREIERREGFELHTLLHHLITISKLMKKEFLKDYILNVIIPTFVREKETFFKDPENNQDSKLTANFCLQILCEHGKNDFIVKYLLKTEIIVHLKDCSLVPMMSFNVCMIFRYGIDYINKKRKDNNQEENDQRNEITQQIKTILFSNIRYLINELVIIYDQVGLSNTLSNIASNFNDFEILDENIVTIKENLTNVDVLLLNTIHWKILCHLITKHSSFQSDFVACICNNFNGNILFNIAYQALNSILLKKETSPFHQNLSAISFSEKVSDFSKYTTFYERCDYLSPIIMSKYDINYDLIINRSYKLFEICQNFTDKLNEESDDENSFRILFHTARDKKLKLTFNTATIHRDNFLTENIEAYVGQINRRQSDEHNQELHTQHHQWINSLLEGKSIRDAFTKFVSKFFQSEKELNAIYRLNTIKEITCKFGLRYLSSIARNCFDICFRLSNSNKFNTKMSTALEELKLLLLQDDWSENKEAMIDALQLLLGVAEMKTRSINQLMFTNINTHIDDGMLELNIDNEEFFNSSNEKIIFSDSDSEDEDKKTEIYFTADENYDADEEYFSTRADETECSQSSINTTLSLTTVWNLKNTNEHICKLVIEVLMDLSKKCIEGKEQWSPELLTMLARRLGCLKNYLGNSEFLLKGFSPIFTKNHSDFRTLQNAILELISDLSSPEALKIYFSLLTVNDAPIDLLITRMEYLCNQQLTPIAFSGVQYPIYSADTTSVTSTCDTYIHRTIQSYRDIHLSYKILTPFTEASQIIPLNFLDLKLWNSDGYTLSTWVEMNPCDDEEISSLHLLSFGTDRLLLAVFLNSDGTFEFNVMKPNQNLNHGRGKLKINKMLVDDNKNSATKSSDQCDKENVNKTNIFGIASALLKDREMPNIRTRNSIKKSLRKSLSKEEETSKRMETSKVSVKSKKYRLKYNQWTHIALSLRNSESHISVLLTLNGTDHENIEIPIEDMMEFDCNGMLQLFCIGTQKYPSEMIETSFNYTMSNVLLFKAPLETYLITYLYTLGPDCDNFVDCEIKQILPLIGFLNLRKVFGKIPMIGFYDFLHRLQSNIFLSYSVGKTNYATAFLDPKNEHGKALDIFTIGKLPKASKIDSIPRAVYHNGGLSSLLFLYARTIELTDDPVIQSSALYIFLKVAYSNNYLYAEFEQKKLYNLIVHICKLPNCQKGPAMLKAILDVIYGETMFLKKSKTDSYQINERSELNIQYPSLLVKLVSNFHMFQKTDNSQSKTADLLFKSLMVVVRESHPYKQINRQCLSDHGFFEKLIEFCKMNVAETLTNMKIMPSTALNIIELLKMLSKNPPSMWSLHEIQKLLLLLHNPIESFITHDRMKFSFTLTTTYKRSLKPNKSKQKDAKKQALNFNTKINTTVSSSSAAIPVSTSPSNSQRLSLGNSPKSPIFLSPSIDGNSDSDSKVFKFTMNSSIKKLKVRKFDELTEDQIQKVTKTLKDVKIRKNLLTPSKNQKKRQKRLKKTPKKSPFLAKTSSTPIKRRRRIRKKKKPENVDVDLDLAVTFKALLSTNNICIPEVDDRYGNGINVIEEHLINMLRTATILMDDTRMHNEFHECLKIEFILMFANHSNGNVRAAIIDLVHALTNRQSEDIINSYQKSNFWVHLGNQLSINPINLRMLQAAIDWICSDKIIISEISRIQKIHIKYKPAFRIFIALLQAMSHDSQLMKYSSRFIRLIIETQPDCFQMLLDNALTVTCIKALVRLPDNGDSEPIQLILEQIATKSFTTMGFMHIVWELLYSFNFAERQNQKIRQYHLAILRQLLSMCLVEQTRRDSRNDTISRPHFILTKFLGNLPSSEIKTRFNLIMDRAIQFVVSWEIIDELNSYEIDFVKYLINLYFYGVHQQGFLILWSLNPMCNDEINNYIVRKITSMILSDVSFSLSDLKMTKSLLYQLICINEAVFSEEQIKVIENYCGFSENQQQQISNWSITAIQKIDNMRHNANKDQLHQVYKIVYKSESLVQAAIDSAMRVTRVVNNKQNIFRRKIMNQSKRSQEMDFYSDWYELIQRMTHENAPWYNEELYPTSFELDEREGPEHMRLRLKRTALKIEEKFFLEDFQYKSKYQNKKLLLDFVLNPAESERYTIHKQILFTLIAKHLTMEQEIEGEICITDDLVAFLATRKEDIGNSVIHDIANIDEVWSRRYQHKEVAMEIFFKFSKSLFIIFDTNYDRDVVVNFLNNKIGHKGERKIEEITQKWMENKLTNFEFLMELNKMSGRSYNDLMQYPVFPWVIVNYHEENLDLTSNDTFRKFNKTISTQYEENEEHYVTNYRYLNEQMNDPQSILKPYHYSSHYSNSGTVLHFLVRMPPFTNMFLLYQDHNFDIPDRTFHSLATTFRLTSKESATDVKELVPEFYFLPDFLENNEGFNYGKRQSGEQVNDVKLPAWCENSTRLFILIHRQALESDNVRKNLHHWIDMIFGYKQKGKAAVDAINVFHPATYPEFQITNISDIVERSAYETMVRTYGQMPKQIFTSAHKKATNIVDKSQETRLVLSRVRGLKFGIFTGSPQLPKPKKLTAKTPILCKQKNSKLTLVQDINMFFVIPNSSCLMQGTAEKSYDLVLWKEMDGIIRTKSLGEKRSRKLFHTSTCDPITSCCTDINHCNIWFGHLSGNISVYTRIDVRQQQVKKIEKQQNLFNLTLEAIIDIRLNSSQNSSSTTQNECLIKSKWNYPIKLVRHEKEVLNIKMCMEFKIVVSIGNDGRTVIWDSQKIEYLQTIEPSCYSLKSCLILVDISKTLGDILTVFKPQDEPRDEMNDECFEITENNGDDFINISMSITGKSQLRLNNINGKYINHIFIEGIVTAVCFSFIKEGTGVNVIAAAFNDGSVRMYSTWNLDIVREIATGCDTLIKDISFSTNHYLILLTDQEIHLYGSEGLPNERPNFHDIVFIT